MRHLSRAWKSQAGLAALGLLVVLLLAVSGCFRSPRWRATQEPDRSDVRAALTATGHDDLDRDLLAAETPEIPMRARLRPCCAFGADLAAKVGPVPVPAYRIGNILDPEDIGPHTYDSGVLRVRRAEQEAVLLNNENNGLIYTCRGGFIDTAHVRDYADWATFLAMTHLRSLEEGTQIELPPEGGSRRIVFEPVPAELIRRLGSHRTVSATGEWITFQLSIWHEIATWFGWASVPGFSEKASAFSPEDLYSNLLGIKLARAIGHRRSARSEDLYNAGVTQWMNQAIAYLGPVPEDVSRKAMRAVDGVWWDSGTRLPDPRLVLRRSFEFENPVRPWLVPASLAAEPLREELQEHCGDPGNGIPLPFSDRTKEFELGDFATLEIEVDDRLAAQEPFLTMGRKVTQADFPAIIAAIRSQNIEEFGPNADRPD